MLEAASASLLCAGVDARVIVDSDFPSIKSLNSANRNADFLLRLSVMLGHTGIDKTACDGLNLVIARMADGLDPDDIDADSLKRALVEAHSALSNKLDKPVVYVGEQARRFRLNIADAGLLRAACYMEVTDQQSMVELCEYMPSRGDDSCSILCFLNDGPAGEGRSPVEVERSKRDADAFATAKKMMDNFDTGLAFMHQLSEQGVHSLKRVLAESRRTLDSFLYGFMLPNILDGQRMRATNAIVSRFLGMDNAAFGSGKDLAMAADASESFLTSIRLLYTVCALAVMCDHGLAEKYGSVDAAHGSAEWAKMCELTTTVSSKWSETLKADRVTARSTNSGIMSCIANWFDRCLRDRAAFAAIKAAMTCKVFDLSPVANRQALDAWASFGQGQPAKCVSLWTAAAYLVSARLQTHDAGGGNIVVSAMAVLSGAIMHTERVGINGPFVLTLSVWNNVQKEFKKFTKLRGLVLAQPSQRSGVDKICHDSKPTRSAVKPASFTGRMQHKKSPSHETRVVATFFHLAVTESIMIDLRTIPGVPNAKKGATAAPTEGRKDLRRLYVASYQILPSVNQSTAAGTGALHMLEVPHKQRIARSAPLGHTTADNVSSAWSKILGGAFFSTIMYSIAGPCFSETCRQLGQMDPSTDESVFRSSTNNCVNLLISNVRKRAAESFGMDRWTYNDGSSEPVLQERRSAERMLGQQHSLVHHVCNVTEDAGGLWEEFKQMYTTNPETDTAFDFQYTDSDDDEEFKTVWVRGRKRSRGE